MFRRTLRKLTALNSLVFLLIFLIFGSVVYGFINYRLFDRLDDAMLTQASALKLASGRFVFGTRPLFDPRTFLLLRGTDGRVVNPFPIRTEEYSKIAEVVPKGPSERPLTRVYEDHVYRLTIVPYRYEEKQWPGAERFFIQDVIAVSIVDSEVSLLSNLFWIMVGGLIAGVVAIALAGFFLAKRAMVPIQAAWERQQQFVSDASHELRSPVTGIYSNAELMLRHPEHTVEQESHRINTIMKESMRMTRLISSLLTLARSDANQAELHLTSVNISEVIEGAVSGFMPMEELKGIKLSLNVEPDLELMADKERLYQLIVILLDNAFKYTASGGEIIVSCFRSERNVKISVQDTGVGISPENMPRIFDRFFRGDKARTRDSGGTGLGLAIAQWITEKHGGKITVESELGIGTKFTVSLPVAKK